MENEITETITEIVEDELDNVKEEIQEKTDIDKLTNLVETLIQKVDGVYDAVQSLNTRATETEIVVTEIAAEVQDLNMTEQIEQEATIEEIEAEIDNDSQVVEEVLDTNDVVDAILPEHKKAERRLRFL